MFLTTLKTLYKELQQYLQKAEQSEKNYQNWFEKSSQVFTVLNLHNPLPHPFSIDYKNEQYFPDFLVQDITKSWWIFELKRPDTKVHFSKNRRRKFYAEFESYISQCNEYSEFFEDSKNREKLNQKYGIKVQKQVQSIIIASRDAYVDKQWVNNEFVRNRSNRIILLTFDDILNAIFTQIKLLEYPHTNLKGLSGSILFSPVDFSSKKGDQYLIDFGVVP